jgi:hypothetical protein
MTLNAKELLEALTKEAGKQPASTRRPALAADQVHEHAVAVLAQLRGLSKGDKRRVLKKAEKLLDS